MSLVFAQEGTDTRLVSVRTRLGFHSVFHRLWKVVIPTSLEPNGPKPTMPFPALQMLFLKKVLEGYCKGGFYLINSILHTIFKDKPEGIQAFFRGRSQIPVEAARGNLPRAYERVGQRPSYVRVLSV